MANMSYCRFENTNFDFADCLEALLENPYDISEREWDYAEALARKAAKYLQAFEEAKLDREEE